MNPDNRSLKPPEPADPMELAAATVPGNGLHLARCLVEEFARLGYDADELLLLFQQPDYHLMNLVWRSQGETGVRRMIEEVLSECGTFRVRSARS